MNLIFDLNFVHIIFSERVLFDFKEIHNNAFSKLLAHAHSPLFNVLPCEKANMQVDTNVNKKPELLIIGVDEHDAENVVICLDGVPYDFFHIHYWPFSVTGTQDVILANLSSYIDIFRLKHQIANNMPINKIQLTLGSLLEDIHVTIDARYTHDDEFDYSQYEHDWQQDIEEKHFVLSLFNHYKEVTIMPVFEVDPYTHNFSLKQDEFGKFSFQVRGRYKAIFNSKMLLKTTQYLLEGGTSFTDDCLQQLSKLKHYYGNADKINFTSEIIDFNAHCYIKNHLPSFRDNLNSINKYQQKLMSNCFNETQKANGVRGRKPNSEVKNETENMYILANDGDTQYYILSKLSNITFDVFIDGKKLEQPPSLKVLPEELDEYQQCFEFTCETTSELSFEFRRQTDNKVDLLISLQGV